MRTQLLHAIRFRCQIYFQRIYLVDIVPVPALAKIYIEIPKRLVVIAGF